MKTPETIKTHEPYYQPDAWKQYSVRELGDWVHLLLRRADMRVPGPKRDKDIADAQNYLDMIQSHVDAAKVKVFGNGMHPIR